MFERTLVTCCCTEMRATTVLEALPFHMQMSIGLQLLSVLIIGILLKIQMIYREFG